jgi:hypothetical protein
VKVAWVDTGERTRIVEMTSDPIVQAVMDRMARRSEQGMKTYGVPMTRPDVSTIEWLRHAQEEAMDLAVYLERVISDLSAN